MPANDIYVKYLMHNGIKTGTIAYIDLDEGECVHFKYIKREKLPNGKWRYYYDSSELDKKGQKAKAAETESKLIKVAHENAKKEVDDAQLAVYGAESRLKGAKGLANKYKAWSEADNAKSELKKKERAEKEAKKKYQKASKRAEKLATKYKVAKITSFPARVISKGIVKIANLLSGADKKKKQ